MGWGAEDSLVPSTKDSNRGKDVSGDRLKGTKELYFEVKMLRLRLRGGGNTEESTRREVQVRRGPSAERAGSEPHKGEESLVSKKNP